MPERGWRTKKSQPVAVKTADGLLYIPARIRDKIRFGSGCWKWTGSNDKYTQPYGMTWDGQKVVRAHRLMYEIANGPIPDGLVLDHLCKNTLCVRPSHLEAVTLTENVMRGDAYGPRAVRTNRCKRGHEFTPENTRTDKLGRRTCRTCTQAYQREYGKKRRAMKAAMKEKEVTA